MCEVTYRITFQDRIEGYRVGLAHMTLPSRIVWIMLGLLFLTLPALNTTSHHHPITWLLTTRLSPKFLEKVGLLVCVSLASYFASGLTVWQLTKIRTVKLQERHLLNRVLFGWNRIRWREVNAIVETAEHICFCQNVPTAVVVPKSAFPNKEQARAFVEQAEHYWRRGTGRKDPSALNALGVWPPAPRVPDSQAQGRTPKQ